MQPPVDSAASRERNAPLPSSSRSPVTLGRYQLGCELASGGMATVYLALPTDATLVTRPLALKRIHPHLASEPEFVQMFIDEARIASKLSHPNLCGVLDFGQVDGTYFMTMEYLVGEPLNRLHKALFAAPERVVSLSHQRVVAQIIADAAEGLHAAHELRDDHGRPLNVVHRDVSPSNLFVAYDGITRVVDFGIASAEDRLHHTATGSIKGKFGYMPPEQLKGEKVGRGADVWALGVVLWESLAGRRLFRRANASLTVLATLEGRVPPLSEVVRGIDPGICAIVRRALAFDREARFPTAGMLADALQRFLARTGSPNARPEVGACLHAAFPHGEAEKQLLMKAVTEERRTIEAPGPNDTHPSLSRTLHSGIVVRAEAESASGEVVEAAEPAPSAPRSRGAALTTVALGLAAVLVGFGTAWAAWAAWTSIGTPSPRAVASIAASALAHPVKAPAPQQPAEGEPAAAAAPRVEAPAAPAAATPSSAPPAVSDEPAIDEPIVAEDTPRDRAGRRRAVRARVDRVSASTEAARGVVNVVTVGDWGRVYLEGRLIGNAPGRFTLPAGRQVLSVRPANGGEPRVLVVRVRPNATVRVRTAL